MSARENWVKISWERWKRDSDQGRDGGADEGKTRLI